MNSVPNLAFSIPTASESEQHDLFDRFADYGYTGLQLKGGQYLTYLEEPDRFLRDWKSNAELSLIFWGPLDSAGTARLRQAFRFANAVGAGTLIFCHALPRSEVHADDMPSIARQVS